LYRNFKPPSFKRRVEAGKTSAKSHIREKPNSSASLAEVSKLDQDFNIMEFLLSNENLLVKCISCIECNVLSIRRA